MSDKKLGSGTFEKISRGIFDEFWVLKMNPAQYAASAPSPIQAEIKSFTRDAVEWSDLLSNIAKQHVNYDGPCHYTIETDGIDEPSLFTQFMNWDSDA